MHLILCSSTGALVTVAISIVPDGGFQRESTNGWQSCRRIMMGCHVVLDIILMAKITYPQD